MVETKTKNTFEKVDNGSFEVLQYTLPNGLKLFLSINQTEPRIFTNIAVRAGSKHDPAETTGLAHYMEHMLFKGTNQLGTLDWEQEKVILEKISDLYEQHRAAKDEEERRKLYIEIDRVSGEAAKWVAPNEYDKLASAIGAKSTNAYTWLEQTVYVNDIPSNELERWMQLESERFRMMALRMFHTELETVYEEFNISQDKDARKLNNLIRKLLFPKHPYGTQTTLGAPEHLRNPSQVNIQWYFQTYYVPNNMALVMAGDFDPDEVVALAEKYFGNYESKAIPPFSYEEQPPLNGPIHAELVGLEAELVMMAWRFDGIASKDSLYLMLIQHLLFNQQAGLIDIHLNQQQMVLESEAWSWSYEDYSAFGLYGKPRQNQTLAEVEQLLLGELEKIRQGEFEDWLLEAVITDFRLGEIKASEFDDARVSALTSSFIMGIPWDQYTNRLNEMANITKAEIVAFAQERLDQNYVVVHKKQGVDPNVIKVEKPPFNPVDINRDAVSEYAQSFLATPTPALEPVFVDFKAHIDTVSLSNGIPFDYVQNPNNALFRLDYIFDMGKNSDRKLALAILYFPYLGTDRYSPSQLQQAFFRLGLSFDVTNDDDHTYVSLSGLEDNLEPGMALFEHILSKVQAQEGVLEKVIADVIIRRENAKKDRNYILRNALANYARYGTDSPFSYRLSAAELGQVQPHELIEKIHELSSFQHRIYFYGQKLQQEVKGLLEKYHQVAADLRPPLPNRSYVQLSTDEQRVLFLNYPIVQTDVLLLSKGTPTFSMDEFLMSELYNNYFGYGLSSIVFQEIRESKALAYSTYAFYTSPSRQDQAHYLQAYVGTQPDKLADAIPAFLNILNKMPVVESQIEHAKQSILKVIESERIVPSKIYWTARANKKLGYEHDLRQDLYQTTEAANAPELIDFHERYVADRKYAFLVMGSKEQIDLDYLGNFGPVEEVSLEQIFGY
jgi:predicted Zn-dependent peptidase